MKLLLLIIPALVYGQFDKQIPIDKKAHLLAGAAISGATYGIVLNKTGNKKKAFIWSLVTPLVIGTLKEVYDNSQPDGRFSTLDVGVTVVGGLTMSLIFKL